MANDAQLRSQLVKAASRLPKGNEARRQILAVLQEENVKVAAAPPWAMRSIAKIKAGLDELFSEVAARYEGEQPSGMYSEGTGMANEVFATMGEILGKKLVQYAHPEVNDYVHSLQVALKKADQEVGERMYRSP